MRIFVLIILAVISSLSYSQSTYFNEVYPPIESESTMQAKVYVSVSEYLSLGVKVGGIIGRRVSTEGIELFEKSTILPFFNSPTIPVSENILKSENLYFVQQAAYNEFQLNYPCIIALNENLDTIWTWCANWPMYYGDNFLPVGFTQLTNGNLLSVSLARFGDLGGIDSADSTGLRFTQINTQGDVVANYVNIYPDNVYCGEFIASGVRQIEDFLILWGNSAAQCESDRQSFFLKTTLTGEILDEFFFGNPESCFDWQGAATFTIDNHIVFTYPYCVQEEDNNTIHEQHIVDFDPVSWQLISEESVEIVEWNQPMIVLGNNESVVISPDGNFVITGYLGIDNGEYPIATPRVFKTSQQGNLSWYFEYQSGLDTYSESLLDIENTQDGGFILTGMIELFPTLAQRHWMVKIDSCGYEQPGFCFPDAVVERENLEVKLWPNPTHHVLKAQLPVSTESVELYNAAGRIIFSEKVYHRSQQWNIRDLECGVYFLRVLLEDGSVVTERVVKV